MLKIKVVSILSDFDNFYFDLKNKFICDFARIFSKIILILSRLKMLFKRLSQKFAAVSA